MDTPAETQTKVDTVEGLSRLREGDRIKFTSNDGDSVWGYLLHRPRSLLLIDGTHDYLLTLIRDGLSYRRWFNDAGHIVHF